MFLSVFVDFPVQFLLFRDSNAPTPIFVAP